MPTLLHKLILYLAQISVQKMVLADFGDRLVDWMVLLVLGPSLMQD